jgi:hypothetical protein
MFSVSEKGFANVNGVCERGVSGKGKYGFEEGRTGVGDRGNIGYVGYQVICWVRFVSGAVLGEIWEVYLVERRWYG